MVGSMSLLILFIILGTYRTRMVNPTPRNTTGADLYTGLAPTSLPDNDSTTQATVHPATGSASIEYVPDPFFIFCSSIGSLVDRLNYANGSMSKSNETYIV